MPILRRHLRWLRRTLAYGAALLLVLVAVVLGIANQLLPLAERHPDRVAAWLSQRAGRTLDFDRVQTDWTRRGPLLRLENLRVSDGGQTFTIGDTEMLVSLYAGLLPGQPLSELRLRGVDLTLERLDDGRWRVRGLPGYEDQAQQADPLAALEGLGELQVIGGRLAVIAPELGLDAHIPRVDLRVRVEGDRVRAGLRAWARPGGQPLDAALDLDRARGDGTVYAGSRRADLDDWSRLVRYAGVIVHDGRGRAQAWARLDAYRVREVTIDAALRDVTLIGAVLDGRLPQARYGLVEARARWRQADGDWALLAPRLRIGNDEHVQQLDGLAVAGGGRFALKAARLDAEPLLELAMLSDRMNPGLRQWLHEARPRMTLRDLDVAGRPGGSLRARASVDGFGFEPVGDAPGLSGLGGALLGSESGFSLQLDETASTRFDWPSGFGVPHEVTLRGAVVGWREGDRWSVATPALHIDGEGYAVGARGGLAWQGDGTRPRIDIAVEVEEGSLPIAKGFWVRHLMSEPLVDWLDAALVAGRVEGGRAIASGDLDDWPFLDRDGRFEATAHIADATLKFQPDWPAAEQLDADVRFVADGFTVEGRARLGDVEVQSLRAGIDHYRGGRLRVSAATRTDAARLLDVLRRSPLRHEHRETFANLTASGPVAATFMLDLPMRENARAAIAGHVALQGARLADARWNLAFGGVRGRAVYSRDGFEAEDLTVRHAGQPGRLSLRAGTTFVHDIRNAFEAALDASLASDELVARAPAGLAWLRPRLAGRSAWSIGVAIPRAAGAPATLQLQSSLVGTALDLPAPLDKAAGTPLATTVEALLPLERGDVRISLGERAAVRARTHGNRTGVRIALGESRTTEAPPPHGLVVTGRTATLDALQWIALAHGGGRGNDGLPLERIDITAQRLGLFGGTFADTRVVAGPADAGTAVRLEGPALEGALRVPEADGAAIEGRFERVHWRPLAQAVASQKAAAIATASGTATGGTAPGASAASGPASAPDTVDPAAIPPLAFDITDLRIADARLGRASLRTRPAGAGLRIEQLEAKTPTQRIALTGDWTGRGAGARTRLDATLGSDDFGALAAGLGFGGRLGGGEGSVRLAAAWDGSPAEFALASLEGKLELDARDGRLLEVEPGAGRVLGLLSLAELPRRLTLDFRDFFAKGFTFNTLSGTVHFADGSARSDDLRIDGPAAAIAIRGAANLRTEHFDQTVEVSPKSGNLLAAVGAIAGGPVGAAIGAAANAVLRKPLAQIGAKTYRVTGSWDEPKVEVINREQSQASEAVEPAAG